ncbi:MAG: AraC family transcriptional regulator [Chitinophagaceae bacterium]|nr:AraC family transcriptional regulator [Chitinophagaceae bacterium]
MKAPTPGTHFSLWRSEHLFNIDFAGYKLLHHDFPRHFHDHYVIELVLSGADCFYCDGRNYTASHDQLILINPGEVHTGSTVADTPLHYFSLYPDRKALQQVAEVLCLPFTAEHNFRKVLVDQSPLAGKLKLLFDSLVSHAEIVKQEELFFDCMSDLLQQRFAEEEEDKIATRYDPRIKLLVDFIHSNFKEDISLKQMSGLVNLNPFHVVRLFKKNTGLSPYDYLLIIKTEHAKQLLRQGYKVQDAASRSGFYDASHLNRSLRRITGTSPKSYLSSQCQYCTSF